MLRSWLTLVLLAGCADGAAITTNLTAGDDSSRSVGASRGADESASDAANRVLGAKADSLDSVNSVYAHRVALDSIDTSAVPVFTSDQLVAGFQLARDTRLMTTGDRPDFPRRPSFLFPDDGCFVRAETMAYELDGNGYPRPAKVFSFGPLSVKTTNAPSGSVSWWYHVAPIVKVNDQIYVLDPSIEPSAAITLSDWVSRQASLTDATVSVCNEYAYTPDSDCTAAKPVDAQAAAMAGQGNYLASEWDRQVALSRDPMQVLGNAPPWIAAAAPNN